MYVVPHAGDPQPNSEADGLTAKEVGRLLGSGVSIAMITAIAWALGAPAGYAFLFVWAAVLTSNTIRRRGG